MEFYKISVRAVKNGVIEIYPDFIVYPDTDLMTRGRDFYAVWDEENSIWSRNSMDVQRIVDVGLKEKMKELQSMNPDSRYVVKYAKDYSSGVWRTFRKYLSDSNNNYIQLDQQVTFLSQKVKRSDYVSKRLPYDLRNDPCPAYDEIMSTLYDPTERLKIEWAIGSILAGEGKNIQKFIVLYGEGGSGKSTVLNIIDKLFTGYTAIFNAKELTGANNQYVSGAIFNNDPLVAIQHDGDLSNIKDNSKLNSIVSHEMMDVNEKYKSNYSAKTNAFLFMGTNKPVKITDAKSGIIRRLIDVTPTGNKVPKSRYDILVKQIDFELGAIANKCLKVFKKYGPNYYNSYRPMSMMDKTDYFFNFVQDNLSTFHTDDYVSLKSAYALYKDYCIETSSEYVMQRQIFREELKNYFKTYIKDTNVDGVHIRNAYKDLRIELFADTIGKTEDKSYKEEKEIGEWLDLKEGIPSIFDTTYADRPAQYANKYDTPSDAWDDVQTTLKDLDTSRTHYVLLPGNHITIDFDLKDEEGNKDYEKNRQAAMEFPPTYAETSKSGTGIHLEYIYDGDATNLSRVYSENVEIKVSTGKSSLRRKLVKCNDLPIAHICDGLPLKGDTKMVNFEAITNEKAIRTIIIKNLRKEYHAATKPSVDFIYDTLQKAYESGLKYDVSDLRNDVYNFAMNSSHQSDYCMKLVGKMKFMSDEPNEAVAYNADEDSIVFYDVEVFPNLFVVCWKLAGKEHNVVKLINPKSYLIEDLLRYKLVGFNNRKYDNHIIYAAMMGYTPEQLYKLSQNIIVNHTGFIREAYGLSYTDIYDYSVNKQSLKKWEIDLGISHVENSYPWDKPIPKEKWEEIADYCANDVIATEAVWEATEGDFKARQILAELAGMTPNDPTNTLTTNFIFGKERHPKLVYTDLSEVFPGYEFIPAGKIDKDKHNMYRGIDLGFGGLVISAPGMYGRAKTSDCLSQHPTSAIQMNYFGDYTPLFASLLEARAAIKHKDFDKARKLLDGKLAPYLDDPAQAKALSNALKLAINSVYGLTSASFENPFRHPDNENNIVALRGALFMATLKDELEANGHTVIHVKTDSIKVVNPSHDSDRIINEMGLKYGYKLETEHIFERICLVDKANYVAKLAMDDPEEPGKWTATGDKFSVPYIFKTLFSHEKIELKDLSEVKQVKSALYLDMNEGLPDVSSYEKEYDIRLKLKNWDNSKKPPKQIYPELTDEELEKEIAKGHNYIFVGRIGQFTPVKDGCGGGELLRLNGIDDNGNPKYASAEGCKGWRWKETEIIKSLKLNEEIDMRYWNEKVDDVIATLNEYGDVERFLSDDPYEDEWESCNYMNKPIKKIS